MSAAAWALPTPRATVLLTFLSVLFAVYGVLSGVALETTRSIAAAARDQHAEGPALWRVAAVVAACSGAAVLVLVPFWRGPVLHGGDDVLVAALVVAVLGYSVHSVLAGAAAGRAWWNPTAMVITAEATLRLLAAHSWYVAGWVVAVVACVALLQADGTMEWRACLALGVAPLVGLAVHVVGLLRIRSAGRTARAEAAGA